MYRKGRKVYQTMMVLSKCCIKRRNIHKWSLHLGKLEPNPRKSNASNQYWVLKMNKFLIWNIRGVANGPSLRRLNKLVRTNKVIFSQFWSPRYLLLILCGIGGSLSVLVANSNNNIWVFWRNLNCQVIEVEDQQITISYPLLDGSLVTVTSVYASCDGRKRRDLWSNLQSLNITSPWLISGDFNVVGK